MSISTQTAFFDARGSSRVAGSSSKFIERRPGPAAKTMLCPGAICSMAFVPSTNCISHRSGWLLAFVMNVPWASPERSPAVEATISACAFGKSPLVTLIAYSISFSPRTKLQSAVTPRFKRLIVTCVQPTALAIFVSEMPRSSRAWTASVGVMLVVPLLCIWSKIIRLARWPASHKERTSWPQANRWAQ